MVKIHFSFSNEQREGFETRLPGATHDIASESVEEITGQDVLEKVPDLIAFIEECYRILRPEGKAIFSSPHYASTNAWISPITKRAISERTLNFASKDWRSQTRWAEAPCVCNFDVAGSVAIEEQCMLRAEEVRAFWLHHYNNVAQCILFTLSKKPQ